jgi:3-oxoacyl-[acyl-carrier protein] reductase
MIDLEASTKGDKASLKIEVDDSLIESFAEYSGDRNPIHLDADYAKTTRFKRRVAHGMSYGALFSRLIGMDLPGPGALWMSQNFRFAQPAFLGDQLELSVEIEKVNKSTRTFTLDCRVINQLGQEIMSGTGEVMLLEAKSENKKIKEVINPVAIVTGGSRGIGAAIAARLSQDGYKVAITYKNAENEANKVAAKLERATCFKCDICDSDAMAKLPEQVIRTLGKPNLIVLNASDRDLYGEVADANFNKFERHLSGQLQGSHSLVSALRGNMIDSGGGSIIAIGTTFARGAPPAGMAPYIVAKSALEAYIRCLAVEYGPKGIRSNIVAPSMTNTALISGVSERILKVSAAKNPSRRLAQPEDIAGAVSYLASPEAKYVNGHTLVVSGGGDIV